MKKSDRIFDKIRFQTSKIPQGKVATYGQIAKLVGTKDARMVGWALHGNQNPKVPCHRVIHKDGTLAENFSLGGWQEQKFRLENDGVIFVKDNQVNLEKHRWIPGRGAGDDRKRKGGSSRMAGKKREKNP